MQRFLFPALLLLLFVVTSGCEIVALGGATGIIKYAVDTDNKTLEVQSDRIRAFEDMITVVEARNAKIKDSSISEGSMMAVSDKEVIWVYMKEGQGDTLIVSVKVKPRGAVPDKYAADDILKQFKKVNGR